MRYIGIIPARGGSKGVPDKNIRILNGKPLISYTIEAALKSSLDKVIVSTENIEIARIVESYGVKVIQRPKELATDEIPMLPVIEHALSNIEDKFDAVVLLQPTSPMRSYQHINDAINIFNADIHADSLVSVSKVPHIMCPEKVMLFSDGYLLGNNEMLQRQKIQSYYARNGAIYIARPSTIKCSGFLGSFILPYFMKKNESIDIDDIDDWEIAEALMLWQKKRKNATR